MRFLYVFCRLLLAPRLWVRSSAGGCHCRRGHEEPVHKWDRSLYAVQGFALMCIIYIGNRNNLPVYCPRSQSVCGIS